MTGTTGGDEEASTSIAGTMTLSSDNENVCSVEGRLLRMFEDYCRHAAERRSSSSLSTTAYGDLFTVAIRYGFAHLPYKYFDSKGRKFLHDLLQIRGFVMRPLRNISHALNELSEHEASFGFTSWVLSFLTPFLYSQPIYEGRGAALRIRQRMFRKRMFHLREAILCDDWPRVGSLIGCIETIRLDPTQFSVQQRSELYRNVYSKIAPFSVSVFHAGVQRLMHHNIPRDVLAKSIAELMLAMINAEKNYEVLAFLIANGLQHDAEDLVTAISSMTAASQTKPYVLAMRCYKALHRYELWRTSSAEDQPTDAITLVDELIYAINELPRGEAIVFIYAMVHLLGSLDLGNTILDVLTDCCTKTPFMLTHAHHALLSYGLQSEAEQLLSMVVRSSLDLSESDPILLEWVQPRLLNPLNFDLSPEMMPNICKILFEFFDYGENRNNERAWAFMWACIQLLHDDSEVLRSQWQLRSSWWPRFHSIPLSNAGNECRSMVFDSLKRLTYGEQC